MIKKWMIFFSSGLLIGAIGVALISPLLRKPLEEPNTENEYFPVFGIDPHARNSVDPDILYYVKIPGSIPLQHRLQILADTISRIQFAGLPITIFEIEVRQNQKIAVINLNDSSEQLYHTWHDAFQGSTGGMSTEITLVNSFLQQDYQGEWIDGVQFLYNGAPFLPDQWDHVDFSETFMR